MIRSKFYLIKGDGIPIYVGFTNRPIKQRFAEHKADKDFNKYNEVTLEKIDELDYDFTWDEDALYKNANEVSVREAQLVLKYGTQDSKYQKAIGGGVVWSYEKWFVKTNKSNPKFTDMSSDEIQNYVQSERDIEVFMGSFVKHMNDPVEVFMGSFVNHMNNPVELFMGNFVNNMNDPVEVFMKDFVGSMNDPVEVFMGHFVNNMNDPVEVFMGNFVNHMNDPVEVFMGHFVGSMNDPVEVFMKDFVRNMNNPVELFMGNFVNNMNDPVEVFMGHFVRNMNKKEKYNDRY